MLLRKKDNDEEEDRKFKDKKILKGIWKKREVAYVSGEILLKLRPGKDRDSAFMEKVFSGDLKKAKISRKFDKFGIGLIDAGEGVDVLKLCKELAKDPDILYAEPNMVDSVAVTTPNDTDYANQWALPKIEAPNAWDIETGSTNVVIAIIDSGIPMDGTPPSLSHPDLNDNARIILGHDYVNNDDFPLDDYGHGTHVTGIASAQTNNTIGIAGLCWGSRIYVIKVFNNIGDATHQDFHDAVVEAVDYAVSNNLKLVINYSGGGSPSSTKENAVIYARDRDCLIVAAAGNDYQGDVIYPAAYSSIYDNVIAVSATDSLDVFASYSNIGPEINVSAPGSHILSTMPNYHVSLNDPAFTAPSPAYTQNYDHMNGTSMAAPYVSALAALLWSSNSGLSPSEVRDCIENSADDLGDPTWDQWYGYGRIDAYETLGACAPSTCNQILRTELGPGIPYECVTQTICEFLCEHYLVARCWNRCEQYLQIHPCPQRCEFRWEEPRQLECEIRTESIQCPTRCEGGIIVQGCTRDQFIPRKFEEPRRRRVYPEGTMSPTHGKMKHIRPLTRQGRSRSSTKQKPLSHKKRYKSR